jgi:hypothetical protein
MADKLGRFTWFICWISQVVLRLIRSKISSVDHFPADKLGHFKADKLGHFPADKLGHFPADRLGRLTAFWFG